MAIGTLTTSGSPTFNGDGSCTINSPDRVSVPDITLVNKTQMWCACRFKPNYASTDANEHTIFRYGPDTNNEIFTQLGPVQNSDVSTGRDDPEPGGLNALLTGRVFAAGDSITVIGAWRQSEIKVSFNGSVFTIRSNIDNPRLEAATLWDIGSRGYSATGYIDAAVFWLATGFGILSDANAATIGALANTGNTLANFPFPAMFLWNGINTTYEYATFQIAWTGA